MDNKKALRFPVRLWLGQYEKWLLVMYGGVTLRLCEPTLERFLGSFPKKQGLEEFSSIDVTDYRALRESQGISARKLRNELLILRAFWKWLTIDKSLPIMPIKRAFDIQVDSIPIKKRVGITLDSVKRLLQECSPDTREVVFGIMLGNYAMPRGKPAVAIEVAARKAGLRNFSIKKLRLKVMHRLGKDIVQTYLQDLRTSYLNPVPSESRPNISVLKGNSEMSIIPGIPEV